LSLARTLARIEESARAEQLDAVSAELDNLRQDFKHTRGALEALLEREQRTEGGEHG